MQVGHFPASAANSLIQGYCDDFVGFAAILAQTLEQVSMRGIKIEHSRPALQRIEGGMRQLAEAIHELLERHQSGAPPATPAPQSAAPAPATAPVRPAATPAASLRPAVAASGAPPTTSAARPPAPAAGRPAGTPQRPAPPAPPPPSGTETLRGSSQSMPLRSVLQFLGRMRKSGTMQVHLGDERIEFELQNGCVLATTSSNCPADERIDQLLLFLGNCQADRLAPLLPLAAQSIDRFLETAVDQQVATAANAIAALELQVRRRVARACKFAGALYEFVEGSRSAPVGRFRSQPLALA